MPLDTPRYEVVPLIEALAKSISVAIDADTQRVLILQVGEILGTTRDLQAGLPHLDFCSGETTTRLLEKISLSMVEILSGGLQQGERKTRLDLAKKWVGKLIQGIKEYPQWDQALAIQVSASLAASIKSGAGVGLH